MSRKNTLVSWLEVAEVSGFLPPPYISMCLKICFASNFQGLIKKVKSRMKLSVWAVKGDSDLHDRPVHLARDVHAS